MARAQVRAWLVEVYEAAARHSLTDVEVATAFASEIGPLVRSMVRGGQELRIGRPVPPADDASEASEDA